MNAPDSAVEIIRTLKHSGHTAYFVGGCVRDGIRGRKAKDWDIATSARPEDVMKLFPNVVPTGLSFGTVTVVVPHQAFEVTTYRGDSEYTDGRRPDAVTFQDNIHEDLARRDFTMNAVAYDPLADEYIDPHHGKLAIHRKMITAVGKAEDRFNEDALRVYRAARFASQLDFRVDDATTQAMAKMDRKKYANVSMERKVAEFEKLILGANPENGLKLMELSGTLQDLFPGAALINLGVIGLRSLPAVPAVRLAHFLYTYPMDRKDLRVHMSRNLKMATNTVDRTLALMEAITGLYTPALPLDTDARVRWWMSELPPYITAGEAVDAAWLRLDFKTRKRVENVISERPPVAIRHLAIDGEDVQKILGCTPGPQIRLMLHRCLAVVLDNPSNNTVEKLTEVIQTR